MKQKIFFRADAGHQIGFGHIKRCLTIASEIRSRADITFISRNEKNTRDIIRQSGFNFVEIDEHEELPRMAKIIHQNKPDKIVVDHFFKTPKSYVMEIQKLGVKTILLDNIGDGRTVADVVIYPAAHVNPEYFKGISGKLYQGWDYVLVRPEFFGAKEKHKGFRILVSMGGSDPKNITFKIVSALQLIRSDFMAKVIIGPGFARQDWKSTDSRIVFSRPLSSLAKIMLDSDIGVLLFGTTVYEAAAARLPTVLLSAQRPDWESQKDDALRFAKFNTGTYLGDYRDISANVISGRIRELMEKKKSRQIMMKKAALYCKKLRLTTEVIIKC